MGRRVRWAVTCDGPPDPDGRCRYDPGAKSEAADRDLRSSAVGTGKVGAIWVLSPTSCLSARWSRSRSSMLMSKVMRGSIIASRISTITRWRCPSGSSLLAARGSAWLKPGRARVARCQSFLQLRCEGDGVPPSGVVLGAADGRLDREPGAEEQEGGDRERIVGGLDGVHEGEVAGGVGEVHRDYGEAERDAESRSKAQ